MKDRALKLVKLAFAPAALAVVMAFGPTTAFAATHGGGATGTHGFSGGHGISTGRSFSAPRGNFGGGRAFSAPARDFNRGAREFYRGRGYYGGPGWYGPGFGFGIGVYPSYGYAAPTCDPAGFYDEYGNWQFYPGCAVTPYRY